MRTNGLPTDTNLVKRIRHLCEAEEGQCWNRPMITGASKNQMKERRPYITSKCHKM